MESKIIVVIGSLALYMKFIHIIIIIKVKKFI